jgi:hypothetical protein
MIALSLLSALAALGCSAEPEVTTPTALALTISQQDQIVGDIAFDPAFVAWAQQTLGIQTRTTTALAARSHADRALSRQTAMQLVADAHGGAIPTSTLLPALTALTGTTAAELAALQTSSQQVLLKFPSLYQTGPALIGQAIEANSELRALAAASGAHRRNLRSALGDCIDRCTDEYIHDHNQATYIFGFTLLGCTGVLWFPPASIGCFIEGAGQAAWSEADAEIQFDDCVDDCHGEPDYGECQSDADCAKAEWCDTGTLSIGDNVCKADKAIGQVCSRDAKCASGCCKYDFWQNPISETCNPAGDCN